MPAGDYWALVIRDLGVPIDDGLVASLIAIDIDSWTEYRDEMWTLAATFRAVGGKLGLLSNGVREIVERVRADRDLPSLFDAVVISDEVGLAKPEPEIYRLTLSQLGVGRPTRSTWTTGPRTSRWRSSSGCGRSSSPATSRRSARSR